MVEAEMNEYTHYDDEDSTDDLKRRAADMGAPIGTATPLRKD